MEVICLLVQLNYKDSFNYEKISILGSTGSIGVNALHVIDNHPDDFEVFALSGNKNGSLLLEQIKKYKPQYVAVVDLETAEFVEKHIDLNKTKLLKERSGLLELSTLTEN
ncbi:MAG: hypothetical protein Ct9H90mP7_2610 [Candidatus Neomarinimicrobiota bacterium]|nr:MAG: hypothetical protein Ct9H90mP7_2610 [Candidatus Neomarinimicrobiota bacterium]